MNITIEAIPYSTTQWFAGTYISDKGVSYRFTLVRNSDMVNITTEIVWCDDIPKNSRVIEKGIINQYRNNKI